MNISINKFSIYIVLIFLISLNNLISGDLRNITIEDFNGKKTTFSAEEVSDFQFQNKGDNFILNLNMKNKADLKLFDVMSIDSIYFNSEYDTTLIRYMNKTFALSTDSIDYISFTNKFKALLFDSDITNTQDFILDIPDKIKLKIPQGMIDANDHLTIKELNPALMQEFNFTIYKQFEIVLKSKNIFDEPIEIEIPVKNAMLTDTTVNKIIPGYFDEELNQWRCYVFSDYDTENEILKFQTKHLTKLGPLSPRRLAGFTDFSYTPHFNIFWDEKHILSNTEYKSPFPSHSPSYPHFVQDLERYLEESYDAYKAYGLNVPSGKTDVYIQDLEAGGGGEYGGFTGWIYIGSGETDKTLIEPNALQNAAAHEYLHCIQDYYYTMTTNLWWMEAMAVNAERLVWGPNNPAYNYQTCSNEWFRLNNYGNFIKSWDDCNYPPQPNFYIAGNFISWMMQNVKDKNGAKKSANLLYELLLAGSKQWLSSIKSAINTYLDTMELGKGSYSSAIGHYYAKFLEEVHIQQPVSGVGLTPCWELINPHEIKVTEGIVFNVFPNAPVIKDTDPPGTYVNTDKISLNLEPLSGKVLHLYPKMDKDLKYEVSFVSNYGEEFENSSDIAKNLHVSKAYVFKLSQSGKWVYSHAGFNLSENILTWTPNQDSEYLELLFVNTQMDASATINMISVTTKQKD